MKAPFPIDPALTQIAIAYSNRSFIADMVLPRITVGKQEFSYRIYNKEERFTLPDTLVGRRSQPNQVEFGWTEATGSTRDYGLEDPIPQADVLNGGSELRGLAVEGMQELIGLGREARASTLVFTAANYPTANKETLAGNDQWSDHANSDPIDKITAALDTPLMRPNVLVLGQAVFTQLSTHPDIVTAVLGNSVTSGIVARQQIANLFELDEVLVGASRYNSANKGQTASYADLWGKHASLIYRNQRATTTRGVTFGITPQWGGRIAGSQNDPDIGLRGGIRVRTGESVLELITASDAAYFFENAVA